MCHGPGSPSSAVTFLWDRAAQSLAVSGTPTTSNNGGILVQENTEFLLKQLTHQMMYVCYGYVDDVMVKQQIMYVCYGYVDDVMVKQQIMYVCYGYVDDVMVKQVAGRCHYIIYNLSFSTVHHVPQVIIMSVEVQKNNIFNF